MGKIIWSQNAIFDIESIAEFISRDSEDRASLFILRLMESTKRLVEFPFSGRIIPEINNTLKREIIYGSYRIMYQIENDEIFITGVLHGAQIFKL